MSHKLTTGFLSRSALRVAVIGVGGTGSEVLSGLTHLHLALKAFGYGGLIVVAFDPDTVSEANLVRQRYHHTDLGRNKAQVLISRNKAQVLISRINLSCSLNWLAVPQRFGSADGKETWDIVISCVDTRAARSSLHRAAFSKGFHLWKYWLDCGNDLNTGQVILGTPRRPGSELKCGLPCATELHPELMDTTVPEDDAPSCSAMDALSKQDLFVGRMVATHALDLLWQLLRNGELTHHARYFDLAGARLSSRKC